MRRPSRNDIVLLSCSALVVGMVGMSYAAVPLYYLYCRATGYGGTPSRAAQAPATIDAHRSIKIRFDTNVDPALEWSFRPEQGSVDVKVGENKLVFFRATNNAKAAIVGHAAFNVSPDNAAVYFTKIQCFCFTEQRLAAGQTIEMPVSFFVDPKILADRNADDVSEITLSYTFYPAANAKSASVPADRAGG